MMSPSPSPKSPAMLKHWNKTSKIDEDKDCCYDSDTDDPYATDHFRIYEFKIRGCTRSRSHDWTDCPFAHPGEKARRRDPRQYNYSGEVCPEFRQGGYCSRGDDCEFAHGVFECWLHPSRYRTEACKDGKNCKRKVCFFAHSSRQLRDPPPENTSGGSSSLSPASVLSSKSRCYLFCHSVTGSPTSTLPGLSHLSRSPSISPPLSPAHKVAMSRLRSHGAISYKDTLSELMSSLETISFNKGPSSSSPVSTPVASTGLEASRINNHNLSWLDVSFNGDQEFRHQNQLQFALSPSTASHLDGSLSGELFGDDFTPRVGGSRGGGGGRCGGSAYEKVVDDGSAGPDLGWVNDLLM